MPTPTISRDEFLQDVKSHAIVWSIQQFDALTEQHQVAAA